MALGMRPVSAWNVLCHFQLSDVFLSRVYLTQMPLALLGMRSLRPGFRELANVP